MIRMFVSFLLALPLLLLFSCASQPVQYHAPRKNAPVGSRQTAPAVEIKNRPITSSAGTNSTFPPPAEPAAPPAPVKYVPFENKNVAPLAADYLTALRSPGISKKSAQDIIENQLSISQLEKAAAEPALQNYRPQFLSRLAMLSLKERRSAAALEYYRSLVTQYPQHPFATSAQQTILVLQAAESADEKVIGALLPITGKNANVGQHALNALRMGLELNKPNAKYRLAVYDTQSIPETAAAGVDKLIREDKAIALIGGLSSKEAMTIAQRADLFSIPFIGLSQKSGLTSIGEYVFRNSLTPEMQVDQLVQYAYEKLGARKFAILYPNDTYGVEFSNIFWDHVLARNATVTAAQSYDAKENDFTDVIRKLIGTYYPEGRAEEYRDRSKELRLAKKEKLEKNKAKKPTREHEFEENILPPVVDFDVLFLPDSGKTLGQVMAFMKVNDVPKMTYLGTNIWNTPDIVKRAGTQAENIFFVDALDLNDSSVRETAFFKEYSAQYSEEPTLIEMQAFESAKMVRDVLLSGASTRENVAGRLRSLGRSSGVTGELRMSNLREIERPIHVMSLEKGVIKKIE
ncbi:MAG: penicillin-binding protein activator [Bdellovibrionaceae bacterium]|nr:penicillin-binding protein activator [Bdellovibrio sp.]